MIQRPMCDCFRQSFPSAFVIFLCAWLGSLSALAQTAIRSDVLVLTNAAEIRALTPAEAAKKIPVCVRGILMEGNPGSENFSLVDETAGIYAEGPLNSLSGMSRGDWIEVEGVTDPGKFAPFIKASRVRKLGRGKIPDPRRATSEDIFSGRMDAQWIEISGVVRRVTSGPVPIILEVALENGGGRIFVHDIGQSMAVDSKIRLRGVCYYQFNKTRQAIKPYLSLSSDEPIVVEEPAVTNLNAIPKRSIGDLMQFNAGENFAHRVRVRGIVIQSQPEEGFWLHDSGHGIHVLCDESESINVGDEAEVFGFLKRGDYGPVIEDAVFKKTARTLPVIPVIRLNKASEALDHDSDLVQCDATIVEQWSTLDGFRLKLADGATEFPAILRSTGHNTLPPRWLTGTRVRITGVCTVVFHTKPTGVGTVEPQFFQLLLRAPADLAILELPSWWNAEHVAWVTGVAAALLLLAVGIVIWIGRRRLRQEAMERMKSEAEFAAVWNERNRMAREIHDTLAQGLSAISMQLEVLKRHLPSEAKARETLEIARTLVRQKLAEARNAIWNVRSQVLEKGDLATALADIVRHLTDGTDTKGELQVRGTVRRLAPVAENNALRITQEAITNAAKYACAQNVLVTMDFEERELRITVSDNGKGFDVNSPPPSEGGFGLKGMQERAAQIHADFSIVSEPGEGTIVTLAVPFSPSASSQEEKVSKTP